MLAVVCFIGLVLFSLCWFWVSARGLRCFAVLVWVCVDCWWGLWAEAGVLCCWLFLVWLIGLLLWV